MAKNAAVRPEADDAPARGVGGLGPHFVGDGAVEGVAHGAVELRLHWIELNGQAHGVVFPDVSCSKRQASGRRVNFYFVDFAYCISFSRRCIERSGRR